MTVILILNIVIIVLLTAVLLLLLSGNRKTEIGAVISLLKQHSNEQRDSVAKQLGDGATEQFRRFSVIQESVNKTLQDSRTETNEQLDSRLSSIQRGNTENIEKVNATLRPKAMNDIKGVANSQVKSLFLVIFQ